MKAESEESLRFVPNPLPIFLLILFLYRGPGDLVRDFLATVVSPAILWVLVFFPGRIKGFSINLLPMLGKAIPYTIRKFIVGFVWHFKTPF